MQTETETTSTVEAAKLPEADYTSTVIARKAEPKYTHANRPHARVSQLRRLNKNHNK